MDQANQLQQDLIHELGLENLPEEKQRELIGKMTEAVLKKIFVETLEKLGDEDKEIYGKMIEERTDPEEIDKFVSEKIPDYEQVLQKIIADFIEEMKQA